MNEVPIRTPFHSIIGVVGEPKAPLEKTSDTVVPYWSSHLDAALSEKIVPAHGNVREARGHRRNQTDFAPAPGLYRKRSLTPSLLRGKTE